MGFEATAPKEITGAENIEAIMQERIDAAREVDEDYPDQNAEWKVNQMMGILSGKIHAVIEKEPDTRLGAAWDSE